MIREKYRIPKIIPPLTLVEIIHADDSTPVWKEEIGMQFKIGYYSRQDGLNTIWLVNKNGEYCETTDRNSLLKYFKIINISASKDYVGDSSEPIQKWQ